MNRQKIVAGNWKMHLNAIEAQQLTKEILAEAKPLLGAHCKAMLFPPMLHIALVADLCKGFEHIYVGAQNMYPKSHGAFTGEVSAPMLVSVGAQSVIIGHSERRILFHETNDFLAEKLLAALQAKLIPIFCVGETLAEREAGKTFEIIEQQLKEGVFIRTASEIEPLIIAYEPVWAIGTGKTASPEQAQEVHAFIRKLLNTHYAHPTLAAQIPILYGGSVKPDNASELFAQADIDGGLIGGASLKATDFIALLKAAQ